MKLRSIPFAECSSTKLWSLGLRSEQIDKLALSLIDGEQWDDAFEQSARLNSRNASLAHRAWSCDEFSLRADRPPVERWVAWADEQRIIAPGIALAHAETYFRHGAWALSESLASTCTRSVTSSDLASSSSPLRRHLRAPARSGGSRMGSLRRGARSCAPPDIRRRALWGRLRNLILDEAARLPSGADRLEEEVDPSPAHLLRLRQAGVVVALRDGDLSNALNAALAVEPLLIEY